MRLALLLFLTLGSTLAQDAGRAIHQQVDKVFAKWDSTASPGCSLSVIKDGKIIYKRGYGMADLDHDIPNTPETVFHVASISKQFTAEAILLLARDGKLSLDDDVRKYITELPDFGSRITIRHLIHHTSGLRDQWELLGLAGWRYSLDLITDNDVLQLISQQKELNFKPGEKHVYCNTGYTLLGQIVKRVSGQSLREFTTKRIFEPLGMKSTHFRDDHAEIVKHIAYGYVDGDGGNSFRLSVTNFDTVGATSLLTTVEDLALWDENFYHPRVGSPAVVEQQLERGKLNSGKELAYASGLEHGVYRGLQTVDHSGADAGYRADLLRFPDQHFSVACLCNKAEAGPTRLTRQVADVYLADQFKEPAKSQVSSATGVSVPQEILKQHSGMYWNKDDERYSRVMVRDGKLFIAGTEWMALANNRFQLPFDPNRTCTFTEAGAGAPARMSIQNLGDKPDVFEQVPELHLTAAQLAAYAGAYKSQEIDPVYRISVEDGGLVLKRLKSEPMKLGPLVGDYFQGLGVIHFDRDAAGKVTGFTLNLGRITNFRFTR